MKRRDVSYYGVEPIIHHLVRYIARMAFILFFTASFILNFASTADATTTALYKYKDNNGVISFTDNIESIPERFRDQVEVIEKKIPKEIEVVPPKTFLQNLSQTLRDFIRNELRNPVVIGALIIIVILLLLCIKLWIKGIILKFIARIAIKIAIVALLYIAGRYLYRVYVPIQKAQKNIERFQEKQEESKQALDRIELGR